MRPAAQHRARPQAPSSPRSPPGPGHGASGLANVRPPRPTATDSRREGRGRAPSSSLKRHNPGLHPGAAGRRVHTQAAWGNRGLEEEQGLDFT